LGRIGREVAARMKAFGMRTIGYDENILANAVNHLGIEWLELEQIWPQADYITVHVPLLPGTKNMINDATIAKCKKGVKFINVARGGIIDENAVLAAISSGQCSGAAFDVYEEEPPKNSALLQNPKVLCTPHLGASTKEAQVRVAEEVAQQFIELKEGNKIWGAVNPQVLKQ
jgi:phosphoglycerate dehydrogenase-like enzyme